MCVRGDDEVWNVVWMVLGVLVVDFSTYGFVLRAKGFVDVVYVNFV